MAINRAPFDALVDDDGSGLTGTVWNKAAIQSVILDPVDAAIRGQLVASTDSGVQSAWLTGLFSGHGGVIWYGSSDLVLYGIAPGAPGQQLTIRNVSPNGAVIYVYSLSGGVASTARIQPYVQIGPTPIALLGSATFIYDSAQLVWSLVAHEQGAWITPPFNAAGYVNMTVSAAQVSTHAYRVSGRTIAVSLALEGFAFTGDPAGVYIAEPYRSVQNWRSPCVVYGAPGGWEHVWAIGNVGGDGFGVQRFPGLPQWDAGLGYMYAVVEYAIQ